MAASSLKPIQIYCADGPAPNPWKVFFVLEELGLPYETVNTPYDTIKTEPFLSINPNGRLPGAVDPNKDIKLWEVSALEYHFPTTFVADAGCKQSGAIIDYLIAEYDPDNKLHYDTFPEKHTTRCWEHFQMSGQGPYFGQLAWFLYYHPERSQAAIDRYANEIKRVTGVIDAHLTKQGTSYLVGDRVTYADVMLVPYYLSTSHMFTDLIDLSQWTAFSAWFARLLERPAIARVAARMKTEIIAAIRAREEAAAAKKN